MQPKCQPTPITAGTSNDAEVNNFGIRSSPNTRSVCKNEFGAIKPTTGSTMGNKNKPSKLTATHRSNQIGSVQRLGVPKLTVS